MGAILVRKADTVFEVFTVVLSEQLKGLEHQQKHGTTSVPF